MLLFRTTPPMAGSAAIDGRPTMQRDLPATSSSAASASAWLPGRAWAMRITAAEGHWRSGCFW